MSIWEQHPASTPHYHWLFLQFLPWKPKKDMYLESAQMFLLKVFSNVGFQLNMEPMAFPWLSPNIIFQIQWKIGGFNHHLGGRMWTSIIFNAFLGSPWEWPRDPGTAQAKNWGGSTVSLLAPQYFTNKWFPTGNEWNPSLGMGQVIGCRIRGQIKKISSRATELMKIYPCPFKDKNFKRNPQNLNWTLLGEDDFQILQKTSKKTVRT